MVHSDKLLNTTTLAVPNSVSKTAPEYGPEVSVETAASFRPGSGFPPSSRASVVS